MEKHEAQSRERLAVPSAPAPERAIYDTAIRLALLGLFIYFSARLLEPFAAILLWAAILTVALFPVHLWLKTRLGGRAGLSAALITIIGLVIILGPIAALGINLAETVQWLVGGVRAGTLQVPPPPDAVRELPLVGPHFAVIWDAAATNLDELVTSNSEVLLSVIRAIFGKIAGVGGGILMFAVAIIVAGFLLGPGERIAEAGRRFGKRVLSDRGVVFVDLAGATIRNVSRGVIGVAAIQTLLAGIGLMMAGVPAAGFICAVILILCIIQIGPILVLLPVIIWAWSTMDTTHALLLTVYLVPVLLIDNLLKPMLMARGLETPMLVILIGVIGGSLAYGLIGLFIGPVILGVFYDIVIAWLADEEVIDGADGG